MRSFTCTAEEGQNAPLGKRPVTHLRSLQSQPSWAASVRREESLRCVMTRTGLSSIHARGRSLSFPFLSFSSLKCLWGQRCWWGVGWVMQRAAASNGAGAAQRALPVSRCGGSRANVLNAAAGQAAKSTHLGQGLGSPSCSYTPPVRAGTAIQLAKLARRRCGMVPPSGERQPAGAA